METDGGLSVVGSATHHWQLEPNSQQKTDIALAAPTKPGEVEVGFNIWLPMVFHRHSAISVTSMSRACTASRGLAAPSRGTNRWCSTCPSRSLPGSLAVSLHVFPSPLAELQQANAALSAESPAGFGSAATAVHLAALAIGYLESGGLTDPDTVLQWKKSLTKNTKHGKAMNAPPAVTTAFGGGSPQACANRLWFDVLTNAGRMVTLESGHADRLARWLLSRRDGKGGFLPDAAANTPATCKFRPIWPMPRSPGPWPPPDKRASSRNCSGWRNSAKSGKPAPVALAAVGLQAAGMTEQAQPLLEKLAAAQQADGRVPAQPLPPRCKPLPWPSGHGIPSPAHLSTFSGRSTG